VKRMEHPQTKAAPLSVMICSDAERDGAPFARA